MAAPFDKLFTFPLNFDVSNIFKPESKICIVSLFGKSQLNSFCSKASFLNPVVDKDIFQGTDGFLRQEIEEGNIECYYDADARVMYMHLVSFYDDNILAQHCLKLSQSTEKAQDFYTWCQEEDLKHAKTLLLLFTLSHLVLLFHPGSTFDLTYLKLFRILDLTRTKLQHYMGEVLKTVPGVSKEWSSFGRVCTPRMLLFFESPAIDIQPEEAECTFPKTTKKPTPMKKLQMSMEDMIYRVSRKTRAITNISNNSLFSLPNNQQFVYLLAKRSEVADPVDFFLSMTRQTCFPHSEESASVNQKPKSYSASRRKVNPPLPETLPLSASSVLSSSSSLSSSSQFCRQDQSVKEFLWQNIEMVFSRTINDNVGRHGTEPIFELPNLSTWLQAANSLYSAFFLDTNDITSQHFSLLKGQLDISTRFSESRCGKVLPLAESAYQQDLPPFYITSYHLNRLAKAQRVFAQYARGPAYDRYLSELQASCESFWKAGRQQCEAKSLTGNLCTQKVHLLPTDIPSSLEDSKKPVADHSSQIKTKAACNCGRVQADKDDPFDHKSANFDFYQTLEENCCGQLEHIAMPVFVPTTPDVRAAVIPSSPVLQQQQQQITQLPLQQQTQENTNKDLDKPDPFLALSDFSFVLSLGQTGTHVGELDPKVSQVDDSKTEMQTQDADIAWTDEVKQRRASRLSSEERSAARSPPLRQPSTTEYLPYMIHSRSPPGLLPLFPSFSLCRLGPSNLYSHVLGMDLLGFLPGSNFLLPWDIAVKSEQEKWPTVTETFGAAKKRQMRKLAKAPLESGETMTPVRVFLGMEYECPRGHRFFCSGPDKIIKVSSNSIVKDNAGRLVHMDMPIYTSCHCKQPKGCLAQMMRVYIVTPCDVVNCPPVRVQINPVIQPGPSLCPQFHPGLDKPLELPPDGIWVLRLPHIYRDETQTYLMPTDHHLLHSCYLLKGMFTYRIL